ncbi:adenylate kinase 7-like [Diachasmimorpha longicaudata]|uniref:adenylate kinase 7-like n=1 Tax=Diachasmimorpha longicaudata TaxID=58733 RepID=UPI0030B89738
MRGSCALKCRLSGVRLRDLRSFEVVLLRVCKTMNNKDYGECRPTFRTPRVFINHMDSYHGRALTDFFLGVHRHGEGEYKHTTWREEDPECEVIGTIHDTESTLNYADITVLDPHNKEDFLKKLLSCQLVIYDITLDAGQIHEAEWALEALAGTLASPEYLPHNAESLHFLLISSVMTWAHTRQLDPQSLNAPLNELDYRKRVPHPNFVSHKDCETRVMLMKEHSMLQKKSEKKLKTLVLCCGITYGNEEGPLHFLFKLAWHNSPFLPIFGTGRNKIPLLHVDDLSRIVHSLFYDWPEDRWYLVATEHDVISQTTIVENISRHMSNGKIKSVETLENSIFKGNISQRDLDVMMVDVNIEPAFTLDHNLQSERTFDMQVERIVDEYRASRNLRPVKIIILGPPAIGKSTVARIISQFYRIPYVSEESLIAEAIRNVTTAGEGGGSLAAKSPEYPKDRDSEGDEKQRVVGASPSSSWKSLGELQRQLDEIHNSFGLNNGQGRDDIVNKLLKTKFKSPECTNQGYVLDGYPRTWNEARDLFDNKLTVTSNTTSSSENLRMFPEFVMQLEATDEFLHNRVLNLPHSVIQTTHYDVESTMKRLEEYRRRNTENDTALRFFTENGLHPLIVDVEEESGGMHTIFHKCLETIGQPRNYGPAVEERVAEAVVRDVANVWGTSVIGAEREEEVNFQRKVIRDQAMREQKNNMENQLKEEEHLLRALSEPLRLYLLKCVFPTLSQGLLSIVQSKPDNPLDALATYLFRNNPEGKMIDIPPELSTELARDSRSDVIMDLREGPLNDIEF